MSEPIKDCPQPETPIRERAWTDEQKVEAMRKDAARYRWLRDHVQPFPNKNEKPHAITRVCVGETLDGYIGWFDLIDKTSHVGVVTLNQAIDGAMQGGSHD